MDPIALSYLFVVFLLLAFITDRLPFVTTVRNISALSKVSMQTISNENIDDDTKQKNLLSNSLQLFLQSLKIIILLAVLFAALWGLIEVSILIPSLSPAYLVRFLTSLAGITVSIIAFLLYYLVRRIYVRIRV